MHSRPTRVFGVVATILFVASACGGGSSPAPGTAGPTTAATTTPATVGPPPTFAPVAVRWYCCLGTGEDPAQVPTENHVADGFATKNPGSCLKIKIVTYDAARDTL